MSRKWASTCHVFRVDVDNAKSWQPLADKKTGLDVVVEGQNVRVSDASKLIEEITLQAATIVACTSSKFVQLNTPEPCNVYGFGFRKEEDRKQFQAMIQGIIDEKKKDRRGFQDHAKENDRLRQKISLKDEEINDLRVKNRKLELELKETHLKVSELKKSSISFEAKAALLEKKLEKLQEASEHDLPTVLPIPNVVGDLIRHRDQLDEIIDRLSQFSEGKGPPQRFTPPNLSENHDKSNSTRHTHSSDNEIIHSQSELL
ncbi:Oidioi.mRNA.OKI2018_I69.XSR.g16920.t1.cds [Oikopleura dioica]|uniref:Oidioi.mRNA.OKI2018_I69.XSR.g16920.t1.cds n=1 Tax=Oikopleura dioica TaxID=34765 RepID=A0ABN7SHL7_OIKDI|nr:Oidioi.mRNA.OKI2018_I69.XSR.g16920.t1.cds [Oikopleura dioica]